jgi:hypothetical protein
MKSIHRSNLKRALMAGAASLAFALMGAAGVRADIVSVQGDDGASGEDGVNPGDPGLPGDDGEPVIAAAGSTIPITAPLNKATATGGNGGAGGNGNAYGNGGYGGTGGASDSSASTTAISGPAEADSIAFGGNGGAGGKPGGSLP